MNRFINIKAFSVTFIIMLLVTFASAAFVQSTSRDYYDPLPNAIDDEKTIIRNNFGAFKPIFYKETVECYCAEAEPKYKIGIGALYYEAVSLVLSLGVGMLFVRNNKYGGDTYE